MINLVRTAGGFFRWNAFVGVAALGALALALTAGNASADPLIWNDGTGNFIGSPTWSYDNGGSVATTSNPFTYVGSGGGSGGENIVIIGNAGDVTLNSANQGPFMDNSLHELRVGTLAPEADLTGIGGPNLQGNGTFTVSNVDLLLFDTDAIGTGNLILGGAAGVTGAMNWNSTGNLQANGQFRVGQNGTGTFNMNGGTAQFGDTAGPSKAAQVASAGGLGTLNLNDGAITIGSQDDGAGFEIRRTLQVGTGGGSQGVLNLGDGTGATGSASIEHWGNVEIGSGSGTGTLNIMADGRLTIPFTPVLGISSSLLVGPGGGSTGAINQTGGSLDMDGLLQIANNTGVGSYTLSGSTGTVNVRAVSAFAGSTFTFNLDAGGATKITVEGGTNTAGDTGAGNGVTLAGGMLNVNGLGSYSSTNSIVLFDQLDASAQLIGAFGNLIQGQVVGQNGGGANFYLNLYGGDGNDIVLQSTLPSSSTNGLVWNVGTANFDAGWASGNGSFGVAATGVDPFNSLQTLYLGNNGAATYDGSTNDASGTTVKNLFIGTNQAAAVVAGRNGNGTLTVSGAENLTIDDAGAAGAEGFFIVGEAGFTGTVNWSSSGTLDVQGQFRVGRSGGTGVFTQNNGVVQAGTTGGGGKYLGIGDGTGSTGTYNLNNGTLYPDGPGAGNPLRQFRVGHAGATGTFNLGDGVGAAGTAVLETEDDVWVGSQSGNGTLAIKSDGVLRLIGNNAPLFVGYRTGGSAGTGVVNQTGGSVTLEDAFSIGEGAGTTGEYQFSGGTIQAANDGAGDVRIGGGGGNGTFRISGTASFTTQGNLYIAEAGGAGTTGLLELTGSQASFTVNRLENAPGTAGAGSGNFETIRWVADANGITPIVVTGASGMNVLQIQDPAEVTANTGTNGGGDLMGDGIALELDLSALSGSQTLTLFDNQSAEAVIGFFEAGTTMNLYEQGEAILGTGFAGAVTISYTGGTGNDVVLNLNAGLPGDFNSDTFVNGTDFLIWQRGYPGNQPGQLLSDWEANFGAGLPPTKAAAAAVPEPTGALLIGVLSCLTLSWATRRRVHGATVSR
ncbi:MAG: hypothetical protein KDA44_09505 [Planctomycetales bacterium]|nr:hypothetical protein [Planctomycetales bacterium]